VDAVRHRAATLIALYASEYMEHDAGLGYCRFFAGVQRVRLRMSLPGHGRQPAHALPGLGGRGPSLLLAHRLLLQEAQAAVAAAQKAFIVNRIGDLGLPSALYLTWHYFGTVEYTEIFARDRSGSARTTAGAPLGGWQVKAIPLLLMLGAFGKSAQLPLYVWLPDAMEGPTPVSALIHAATMVTAGVYLLCRMFPLLRRPCTRSPCPPWRGSAATALLAATIGMAQFDIKRIMAYSTVSQLGYMFMGVGAADHLRRRLPRLHPRLLQGRALPHLRRHHARLRGPARPPQALRPPPHARLAHRQLHHALRLPVPRRLPLHLLGVLLQGHDHGRAVRRSRRRPHHGFFWLGIIGVVTALMTAYYTFRVWFRVCAGPQQLRNGR
jgi:NADH-quinone oxidoreductase subunit L